MKNTNKINRPMNIEQKHYFPLYEDAMDIVSSTECTGMMYKPPLTDEEVAGYTDIYPVRQQKSQPSPTSSLK